jgi:hypothetical protein
MELQFVKLYMLNILQVHSFIQTLLKSAPKERSSDKRYIDKFDKYSEK